MEASIKRILCVDDELMNLDLLEGYLSQMNYEVLKAPSGRQALDLLKDHQVDLVLLDVMMPGMNGFEVCRAIKDDENTWRIPVVIVTALADKQSRLKGLEAGANDFLTKPLDGTELLVRTRNLLRVKEFEDFLQNHNEILNAQVCEKTQQLRFSLIDTVHRLTLAAEYKDEDTAAHLRRTSLYTQLLAGELGFGEGDVETFFYAAPMHDVGKIGIPDAILSKPSGLTQEEFAVMKTHAVIGAKILGGGDSPLLQTAERFSVSHHERWDGTGYPACLQGEGIPVEGRLFTIVDQYDALRSRRPYKPTFAHDQTFRIITEGDGRTMPSHFEPRVLAAFKDNHLKFKEIFEENP